MKEVKVKLFKFEELSEEVRKKLIEKNRWELGYGAMERFSSERQDTLEKFEKVFGINVRYEVDYCSYFCRVDFETTVYEKYDSETGWMEEILPEEVSGKLLLRYLNSKFLDLHNPKRYWGEFRWDENGKSLTKKRTSRIKWEDCCPLTGVCYDEDILEPIRNYLKKPDKSLTLKDLIEECIDTFVRLWHEEYEYCCDNETFLEEEFENRHENDFFYEDGTTFNGIYEDVA